MAKFDARRRHGAVLAATVLAAWPLAALSQETGGDVTRTVLPPVVEAPASAAAEADTQLGSDAAALRDALGAAAEALDTDARAAVMAFYEARDFELYWSQSGREATLAAALSQSDRQGLAPGRYAMEAPNNAAASDAAGMAAREVAAMRAYLRFGGDLSAGIVQPAAVDPEINRKPEPAAPAALLARLKDEAPEAVLEGLAPASPEYAALVAEKARLEALLATDAWGAPVPEGTTLERGDSASRVAALRARLERMGYEGAAAEAEVAQAPDTSSEIADLRAKVTRALDSEVYEADLEAAVKRFQADHGLLQDGVAGPRTLAAINTGLRTRIEQVVVNLERQRWMAGLLDERHIEVNIPDYSVALFDGNEAVYRTRAIVGQAADTRTPEFSDTLTYFVVNPTWHIPDSIAKRVYLPKLKRDPQVLANNNMRLFTRSGMEIDPGLVDFTNVSAASFPFRIKQNPSAANALGRVKFMFPNQFAIYLHDTPARELFGKDARAFSNGCVRLEDPLELAYMLLGDQVDDPQARFQAWLDAKAEKHVTLKRPIPVHILYRTVFVDEAGAVRYRDDIYGRDRAVFRALEEAGVTLPAAQG